MTILAITANGGELEAAMEGNFNKALNFIFYDTDQSEIIDVVDNPMREGDGGAVAGQMIVGHDAEVLLSGSVDPTAGDILGAGGVEVFKCSGGSVLSAVERFIHGDLEPRAGSNRGFYPGPGSPETPHSRDTTANDPGTETRDSEVVGVEIECLCVFCGNTVCLDPGVQTCEQMKCPACGGDMLKHLKVD